MSLLLGIGCGMTGAICWGLVDSCATIASRRIGTLLTSIGMQVAALVPLAALFIVTGRAVPADMPLVAQSAAVGVISAGGYLLTYQAFRLGPVSVVSPVMSAYGGLSVVFAVALLDETLRPLQAAGVVVATAGIVLTGTVLDGGWRQTRVVRQGVPYAVASMVVWAVTVVGMAAPVRQLGWLQMLLIARVATLLALLAVAAIRPPTCSFAGDEAGPDPSGARRSHRPLGRLDGRALVLVVAMGLLDVVGVSAWSIGLEVSAAWLVGIVGSYGPIISLTFGVVVLHERLRPNQWLGIAIVLSSIALIGSP